MRVLPTVLLLAILPTGCAHSLMRGSVAMKMNKDEAHVRPGENEVKVGDTLAAFKNDCTGIGKVRTCKKVRVGEGEVREIINQHYSLVQFPENVEFDEGYIVEKN